MLNQAFECDDVPPEAMDELWATGWRHFGSHFFRYSHTIETDEWKQITPLRIRLSQFSLSSSQRRVMRRNADLEWEIETAGFRSDTVRLFDLHKQRFKDGAPDSLADFLSPEPGHMPCLCHEIRVLTKGNLLAASFLDAGKNAASGIYAVFDPRHQRRSLGIFTMLLEIQWCIDSGRAFYYPGYATQEPGLYDYKKQFRGLEYLDWSDGQWKSLAPCPSA